MSTHETARELELAVVRRQIRRSERRDRVYEAAVSLFIEQGYDGTTMDDVASRAGVARTSVFNYFERKSALLEDWAARRRARAFGIAASPGSPAKAQLTQLMTVLADASSERREETIAMFVPAVRELDLLATSALAGELTSLVEQGSAGARPGRIDSELVGLTLATGYFAVLHAWCEPGPTPFDLRERLRDLVRLIAAGI